ncbi:tyrosine-protein phosphatase [Pseudarthrobacter sp. N5]|uniref:tyrosine-protein phosphatase n=1 Tax=Pseudarthrobacter sp. N5 TaxID=3418416 RepID=UPI003CEBA356
MNWDGAVNAWRVAGAVYRMGRREWVTEAGWKAAYDDGVRTVIDLRNAVEMRRRDADPQVSLETMAAFDVVLAPTEDPGNPEFKALCVPYLNNPSYYAEIARLFPEKLAAVFQAIAAAPAGVVIHCSAGRDRSGMIAAMLQDLAGHSDRAITQGYQWAMRGINDRHRAHGAPHVHERYLDEAALAPLLESCGASVVEFARQLDTPRFLLRNGVTEAELEAILSVLGARVSR